MVYKVIPPKGFRWMDVNNYAGIRGMQELVKDAEKLVVPHKQNRWVIFDSVLIHASDKFSFKPG